MGDKLKIKGKFKEGQAMGDKAEIELSVEELAKQLTEQEVFDLYVEGRE